MWPDYTLRLATAVAAAAMAGCASTPPARRAAIEVPPLVVRPPVAALPAPSLQRHPNCMPARQAAASGARAAVGIRADTCVADDGSKAAFIVKLIAIQGKPSPADEAGLRAGDEVVAVDGCVVKTAGELTLEIEGIPEGNTTELLVRRGGAGPLTRLKVVTRRWVPANPMLARLPANGNLCGTIQRRAL